MQRIPAEVWRSFALLLGVACAFAIPGLAAARTVAPHAAPAPNFTLFDQNGHAFTLAQHQGHPVVLFFGYTHCPDVCPTILANLKRARAAIGPQASDLIVALITVDPERDSALALKQFVSVFDPSFLGLRGSAAQLAPVYRAYHVRYVKGASNPEGYLVSHTAFVYYIGRSGRIRGFGTWSDPQETLEEDLRAASNR